MSVTPDQPAPYAPASAVLQLIERHRSKGLPHFIDGDVLQRIGVSDSIIPRTLQTLKALELINEDGGLTETFEGLRLAPETEYQQRLAEWLKRVYADALTFVDPATDDEVAIRDAFRKYTPTGQHDRMVTLFIGLFTAAGVMAPKQKAQPAKRAAAPAPRVAKSTLAAIVRGQPKPPALKLPNPQASGLPAAIAGLLTTLPSEGGYWAKERRDQFMTTFAALLDYTFKIGEPPESETETASESDAA
jgi:hypothetical protein